MSHYNSVFANSCIKMPVDPLTKTPSTAYERLGVNQNSEDAPSTVCSVSAFVIDAERLKNFYHSIPDYSDINHLSPEDFYSTLSLLRERKKHMFKQIVDPIVDYDENPIILDEILPTTDSYEINSTNRRQSFDDGTDVTARNKKNINNMTNIKHNTSWQSGNNDHTRNRKTPMDDDRQVSTISKYSSRSKKKILSKPKRNHSACSISWNDLKTEVKDEIDEKFKKFFDVNMNEDQYGDEFKTRSMPSSPLRSKRSVSPLRKTKSITKPKPFKMTERDEENRIVDELRNLRKSLSADALNQKLDRRRCHIKANPVPIESRIPLYDKILQDQAMRRAINKINSEAELRAQMKPFSFTKREEKGQNGVCAKAVHVLPKPKKKKRFKARPIPKNLFSNYFYDKARDEDFFRSMNRQIRADEMLRRSHLPVNMASRDRSRLSTPATHSDLPIDPSPGAQSSTSSERRSKSPTKKKRDKQKQDFITTSPQPFRFSTADRADKKMQEITRIYQDSKASKTTDCVSGSGCSGADARVYSALDLRSALSGRSNLAALLRTEAVRRKFESEALSRMEEQRRLAEKRHRDQILRSKPAWYLVKNNHEEDIALRLQTRRDEERMRREEFLHEMELMYGRVLQQPMLFERYYAPRIHVASDCLQLSPRKGKKGKKINSSNRLSSPTRSRNVSINDTSVDADVLEYLKGIDSDSDGAN